MEEVSLRELSEGYDYVVFDTSVVIAPINRGADSEASQMIIKDLVECDNLVTVFDVQKECPKNLRSLLKDRTLSPGRCGHFGLYQEVFNYLTPVANNLGVLDPKKDYPMADVRVACLAFCMSHVHPYVAFVSSDRKLDELVFKGISMHEKGDFPCSLNNDFHVFSYVRNRNVCVSYDEERSV